MATKTKTKKEKKPKAPKKLVLDGITFQFGKQDGKSQNCIVATSPSGAEWYVYRRHVFQGGATYEVQDLRYWKVGIADNLRELATKLAFCELAMTQLFADEAEIGAAK